MAEKETSSDEATVAEDTVINKYKVAAEIVNSTVKELIKMCIADAKVVDLCDFGDQRILDETGKVFKKEKELKKGIAFPTCISVNNCVCHFSPLKSEAEATLKDGDMVKIDLGAHIDGFIAVVAHTLVIGASKDNKVTGRKADVLMAAHTAAEAAIRLVKPGNENMTVTDAIQKVATEYECKPIEGMLSHQLKQHVIDGPKAIIQNPTEAQRKEHEKCEFEVHEVYAVDVLISSGEGKGRVMDARTTVYKKKDVIYNLKMKTSKQFFTEMRQKYANMPFTLRSFEEEKKAKLGVVECVKHDLVEPFHVLWEKEGEYVAQFKFTVLLMPNGPMKITGGLFEPGTCKADHGLKDADLKALLSTPSTVKGTKKRKKKAAKEASEAVDTPAANTPAAAAAAGGGKC